MTWTRFEPKARRHPKAIKAGNDAASFWQWAIQWSNENETDGYLDESVLHTIPPTAIAPRRAKELAEKCVAAAIKPGGSGLFERVENGYRIHDFHDYQPPSDEELKRKWLSEIRSSAGKKGASKRWQTLDGKPPFAIALPSANRDSKSDNSHSPRADARRNLGSVDGSGDPKVSDTGQEVPESVEPAADSEPESTYDMAWRMWRELYDQSRRKYGRYVDAMIDDDRVIQRLAHKADDMTGVDRGRTTALLRHWFVSYLRDDGDLNCHTDRRHPLKLIERRLPTYGEPKEPASSTRLSAVKPSRPRVSDDDLQASAERNAERALALAAELGGRKKVGG